MTIPDAQVPQLQQLFGPDLGRAALEAFLIEGYRSRKLSTGDVRTLLGLDTRLQAEQWLGNKGVTRNYNADDLEQDRLTLAKLDLKSKTP